MATHALMQMQLQTPAITCSSFSTCHIVVPLILYAYFGTVNVQIVWKLIRALQLCGGHLALALPKIKNISMFNLMLFQVKKKS